MPWFYGRGSNNAPDLSAMGLGIPPQGAAGGGAGAPPEEPNLTRAERKAMEAYRFDSSALERAAQAAKDLEKSSKLLHNR